MTETNLKLKLSQGNGKVGLNTVDLNTDRMKQRLNPIRRWLVSSPERRAPERRDLDAITAAAITAVEEALLKAPNQRTAEVFAYGLRDIAEKNPRAVETVAKKVKALLEKGDVVEAKKEIYDAVGKLERRDSAHGIARP